VRALGLALLLSVGLDGAEAGELLQVKAAVHVHTTFSTGALSLEELIEAARREGIGALILTENFLLRFEYGLFPLRGLLKKVVEQPSALRMGIGPYLRAIEMAQAKSPDVILIPGVEVVPYYYWTGSPLTGDLTQWDAQKNLLVVGLSRPEDYQQIPAIGNDRSLFPRPVGLVQLALAIVAIGGGCLLLATRRVRRIRLTHFDLMVRKRRWLPGAAALGVGGLLFFEAFASSELHPYRGDLGIEPYQQVIDTVRDRGGMSFWSYPEARDFNRIGLGLFGGVVVRTEPYPEALFQSQGYTGFGAVYQDNVSITEPGRGWDRLLEEHAQGLRTLPPWGIGELGYHGPSKRLGDVLSVFLVPGPSREAILEALREGRFYALRPLPDHHLVLADFSISQEGRKEWALMGGELEAAGPGPLLISLKLRASREESVPFTLRLIRAGRILEVRQGRTPFDTVVKVAPPERGRREFFRMEVTAPHRLLSNPIFVRRPG
jgi:hypothetical protein